MRRYALALLLACALPAAAQPKPYDKPQGIYATIEVREVTSAVPTE